jgi:hypothetical protein
VGILGEKSIIRRASSYTIKGRFVQKNPADLQDGSEEPGGARIWAAKISTQINSIFLESGSGPEMKKARNSIRARA